MIDIKSFPFLPIISLLKHINIVNNNKVVLPRFPVIFSQHGRQQVLDIKDTVPSIRIESLIVLHLGDISEIDVEDILAFFSHFLDEFFQG